MPNLSWNEIRNRAALFSRDWSSAEREQADKQTFWNEFFDVFGIQRRLVASFEEAVKRLRGTYGFIDLLWKGKLLIEHKSAGASLEAAETQAFDYIHDLQTVGRGDEIPRYILLSDFQRFVLYDLEPDDQIGLPLFRNRRFTRLAFNLAELESHVRAFAFIPGYQVHTYKPQDPLNLKAVEIMASVHDTLKVGGYSGHDLERFLVRVLFCMFAEDTGIFQPDAFKLFIENRTHPDGSNLGAQLNLLFSTLDKPENERQANLDEELRQFPYINGALFSERLDFAAFTGPMRKALIEAAAFDWSRISPAIFGALFQEVMKDTERRAIGAHYTSERDILKVINPLFLDGLRAEFDTIQRDRSNRRTTRLEDFRTKLTRLNFLDPACGCGNFLVIAYRELRSLELDVLRAQHSTQQAFTLDEVNRLSQVDVTQFYGLEIEEWPVRIAEVALWLMDHQSNLRILEAFSQPFVRIPLRSTPHIHLGNALRMDWNDLLPASECSYVLGNPPFVGHHYQSSRQKEDQQLVLHEIQARGVLDYVSNWYVKAAEYIATTQAPVAFVSTNSITQGEQVGILWNYLFQRFGIKITFAHRTFSWQSEARAAAHVHVVIIAFSSIDSNQKKIFSGAEEDGHAVFSPASNISPYLVEGSDIALLSRASPPPGIPKMSWGNKPTDGGNLILSPEERRQLIQDYPAAKPLVKRYMSGGDFLDGAERYCLWLVDATPEQLGIPPIKHRLAAVKTFRSESKASTTREYAKFPSRFRQIAQPKTAYLAIPEVSSERRDYIPIASLSQNVICSNTIQCIPSASHWLFGILTSRLHMAWARVVAGKLKSDFRYSNSLVYNNYPWPNPTPTQKARVEELAQAVLDARALYPDSTLAQLYDPLLMPPELTKAHQQLDRAVERCYRPEPFTTDRERVEFLFALYEQLTAPLLPAVKKTRRSRTSTPSPP